MRALACKTPEKRSYPGDTVIHGCMNHVGCVVGTFGPADWPTWIGMLQYAFQKMSNVILLNYPLPQTFPSHRFRNARWICIVHCSRCCSSACFIPGASLILLVLHVPDTRSPATWQWPSLFYSVLLVAICTSTAKKRYPGTTIVQGPRSAGILRKTLTTPARIQGGYTRPALTAKMNASLCLVEILKSAKQLLFHCTRGAGRLTW